MDDYMEIGLFQLENLFTNPNRFLFFDLRRQALATRPELDQMLMRATRIEAMGIESYLAENRIDLDFPIVLFCEDGRLSSAQARDLTSAGFRNVYVLTGGVAGLLSEY